MIVKIDNLSHDFKGITKINDKVTFVKNALPKEKVDIKIIKEGKNYNEGIVLSYKEKSKDRYVYPCPFYDKCGSCDIGYIKYHKTLEYKKEIFNNIMKRYADITVNPDIISLDEFKYRNKITLRVDNKGKISLFEEESNNMVNIDNCLIVNDNINKIIKVLSSNNLSGINKVTIRGEEEIMVIFEGDADKDNLISILKNNVVSMILNNKVIYGKDYINIKVNNYNYAIYPMSFFQVNTKVMKKLYDKVKEYARSGNRLLDLYCGSGTIGIYLSDNYKHINGIEINEDAVKGANLNKKINNINNIKFECKKANEIVINNYDTIIVDPPRSGLDKKTIFNLINSNADKIIYVSCNPMTLARDINILKKKYEIKDVTLFDMFPNTKHIESVMVLRKEDKDGR